MRKDTDCYTLFSECKRPRTQRESDASLVSERKSHQSHDTISLYQKLTFHYPLTIERGSSAVSVEQAEAVTD